MVFKRFDFRPGVAERNPTAFAMAHRLAMATALVFLLSSTVSLATGQALTPTFLAALVGICTSLLAAYLPGPANPSHGRTRRRWPPFVLAVACLGMGLCALLRTSPESEVPDVTVSLVNYHLGPGLHGSLKPLKKGRTEGYLNETDDNVAVELQVAVENREKRALHGVRLELSYSEETAVETEGVQKVNTQDGRSVYEHQLGTLEPGRPYYAMQSSDRLDIPVKFHHDEYCHLDEKRMPVCEVLVWDDSAGEQMLECLPFADELICIHGEKGSPSPVTDTVGFRLFTDGRPTLEGSININLDRGEAVMTEDSGPRVLRLTEKDEDWNSSSMARQFGPIEGKVLERWKARLGENRPVTLEYRKIRSSHGRIHQELYVDGVLRKVLIGSDNWVGEQLIDSDGDGEPDVYKIFARFFMLKWRESDFRDSYEID